MESNRQYIFGAHKVGIWFGKFDRNRKLHLFETAPLMGFNSFFLLKISVYSKNNGFREKMYSTLKIDLFIRYNFSRKYFFARSIFIEIKYKNLLKTFFYVFDLENQIRGYFYHYICNQRPKIRGYGEFQINRS